MEALPRLIRERRKGGGDDGARIGARGWWEPTSWAKKDGMGPSTQVRPTRPGDGVPSLGEPGKFNNATASSSWSLA